MPENPSVVGCVWDFGRRKAKTESPFRQQQHRALEKPWKNAVAPMEALVGTAPIDSVNWQTNVIPFRCRETCVFDTDGSHRFRHHRRHLSPFPSIYKISNSTCTLESSPSSKKTVMQTAARKRKKKIANGSKTISMYSKRKSKARYQFICCVCRRKITP